MKESLRPLFEALEPRVLLSASAMPEAEQTAVGAGVLEELNCEEQIVDEILFIDTNVDNYQTLINNLNRNVEIVFIDADSNGIDKITETLSVRNGISAVHILSHGNSGEVNLGALSLNNENINSFQK